MWELNRTVALLITAAALALLSVLLNRNLPIVLCLRGDRLKHPRILRLISEYQSIQQPLLSQVTPTLLILIGRCNPR